MERLEGAGVRLDRYAIFEEIASGGMATVHLGRLVGPVGFSRTVAIKRMHPHLAKENEFVSMFLDEARLVTRIRHPNVVPILDVVSAPGELALVMEFVQGESLDRLLRRMRERGERVSPTIAATIATSMLHGLHAAHEATSEYDEPLGIVHRDVSPQNVLVGIDGVARVVDFGIAKARVRLQTTREGQLKGKLTYMAPEQALREDVDRRTDIFAAGIVLWEMLVGRRLFDGVHEAAILSKLMCDPIVAPSVHFADLAPFDPIVLRALARDPEQRYPTARAMVMELERVAPLATLTDIGAWVERLAGDTIARRVERIRAVERVPFDSLPSSTPPPPMEPVDATMKLPGSFPSIPRPPPVPDMPSPISNAETRVEGRRVVTQVSSISVSVPRPNDDGSPTPGMWWVWAGAATLSALLGGVAAFLLRGGAVPAHDGATMEASERAAAAASADPTSAPEPANEGTNVEDLPTFDPAEDRRGHAGSRPGAPAGKARASAAPSSAPAAQTTPTPRATAAPTVEKPTDYGF